MSRMAAVDGNEGRCSWDRHREVRRKECSMRRALFLASLAAALATPWLVARGQDRPQGLSAIAVSLATRESAGYVKAFNGRNSRALAALFASDASIAFLQGSSVEKLDYGIVEGRDDIVGAHETFFSIFPDARLTQTVLSARMVRPDLLMADVDFEITGLPADAGPIQGRAVVLRVLESGAWKIAAERSFSRTPVIK